jgi:hypothetical protein
LEADANWKNQKQAAATLIKTRKRNAACQLEYDRLVQQRADYLHSTHFVTTLTTANTPNPEVQRYDSAVDAANATLTQAQAQLAAAAENFARSSPPFASSIAAPPLPE